MRDIFENHQEKKIENEKSGKSNVRLSLIHFLDVYSRNQADSPNDQLSNWCTILTEFYFLILLGEQDGHDMTEIPCFGVPGARKIMKLMMFARSQHPHNQKLCGKRSISTQKHPTKKNIFFAENIFSQYFPLFSTPQHLAFCDFVDLGMCPSLPMAFQ